MLRVFPVRQLLPALCRLLPYLRNNRAYTQFLELALRRVYPLTP